MNIENAPKNNADEQNEMHNDERKLSEEELRNKALELEKMNTKVEDMEEGAEREKKIEEMDRLESELESLEKLTNISQDEIMSLYDDLTLETAQKEFGEVLSELNMNDAEKSQLETELNNGNPSSLLKKIKGMFTPRKVALVTASYLVITMSSLSADVKESHAGGPFDFGKIIEKVEDTAKKVGAEIGIDPKDIEINEDTIEQAKEILKNSDERAKEAIESIEGILKGLKQKKVIDTLADKSEEIVKFIQGESKELPQLEDETADTLLGVYAQAIEDADALNDEKVSQEVRNDIINKMKLVQTKDYKKIKKGLQV